MLLLYITPDLAHPSDEWNIWNRYEGLIRVADTFFQINGVEFPRNKTNPGSVETRAVLYLGL